MAEHIQVKCEHCNHLIKAPKSAAGRRGKCPHCQNSVYVPTPDEELEEIPLAPPTHKPDPDGEQEYRRVEADLLREKESEAAASKPGKSAAADRSEAPGGRSVDAGQAILAYLLAMRDSKLDRAQQVVALLNKNSAQAKSKVQQMMVDTMKPTELGDMPDGLYQGFLRKLLDSLK